MHDILKFHRVHGSAIILSDTENAASRHSDFSNGIVFSSQPIKLGQKICLELSQSPQWSGATRIGVTVHDPAKITQDQLPKYVCPDLTDKHGYWARGLNESFASSGNRITFYVNKNGQLHYFVNNEHKGIFLQHIPVGETLWAMFDVYGSTTSVKLISADATPVEIVARGPDAMLAYQNACESGTQPVFRTRLMLVGQERVGKTTLKKALMGISTNPEEETTDGIDLSMSCSFSTKDRSAWRYALHKDLGETLETVNIEDNKDSYISIDLEEEYYDALATNIVQELLYRKHHSRPPTPQHRGNHKTTAHHRSNIKTTEPHSRPSSAHHRNSQHLPEANTEGNLPTPRTPHPLHTPADIHFNDLLQEVPDRVVQLVQEKLREKEIQNAVDCNQKTGVNGSNIELNIWDFAGQAVYYTTHQVFLSSRAVYVIVFNLCQDLDTPTQQTAPWLQQTNVGTQAFSDSEFSSLDYMDYWMNSIHVHTAQNRRNSLGNTTLSPPIFIVGTHKNGLHDDDDVRNKVLEERFHRIKCFLQDKPYEHHVIPQFYAVENNLHNDEDPQVGKLRCHIEDVASKESYMGEQIPLRWLKFEHAVNQLVEQGTYLCSLDQIKEVGLEQGIGTTAELSTLLSFYHDLGVLIYFGGSDTLDSTLQNTVILNPSWLVHMFSRVITATVKHDMNTKQQEQWRRLVQTGVLEERLLEFLWKDAKPQKVALLGLMDKFDLLCQCRLPGNLSNKQKKQTGSLYFVPGCVQRTENHSVQLYQPHRNDVTFYLDFHGFLPVKPVYKDHPREDQNMVFGSRWSLYRDGLFHRIVTRCIRWSQEAGGHQPKLAYKQARFYLDTEHDFVLEMADVHLARIKIDVLRVCDLNEDSESCLSEQSNKSLKAPRPTACAKVRNFLENSLSDLRETWMKRISYEACIECYCDRVCNLHNIQSCANKQCLHFLNLDQCISNKIVCCEHRRIKTAPYRKWFPVPPPIYKPGPVLSESVINTAEIHHGNLEAIQGDFLPAWIKSAAKLLNGGSDDSDWYGLAKKLGYKKCKVTQFHEDYNPALALLTDWIICSGNSSLSIDMLVTFLEQMHRDDVMEIIQRGQELECDPPQVFISYQWDHQDEVSLLRERLESSGFTCWMDIGQMGGGEQLYSRIDEGMRNAKIVISCLSPKYVVSHYCNREMHLADLLRKPIIPVLFEDVPWPPPGAMALIFSQLIYINMKGVGGHGGSGIHADLEDKYKEIIQRVSCHAKPMQKPQIETSPYHEIAKHPDYFHGEGSDASEITEPLQYNMDNTSSPTQHYVVNENPNPQPLTRNESARARRRNTSARINRSGAEPSVEQVTVSNCAVCVIL